MIFQEMKVIEVSDTRPGQFRVFINRLMDSEKASNNYKPFIFPVEKNGKAPDVEISWKAKQTRMTIAEARQRLAENRGNIGIAGRPDDKLILVDIDDPSIESELKNTLKIRSRSRSGTHAIYWAEPEDNRLPANIPTDKGEIRSSDQYVVAPGSYVPVTEEELEEKLQEGEITEERKEEILEDPFRGYYTIDNDKEIATITFEELPEIFQEHVLEAERREEERQKEEEKHSPETVDSNENHSALYDLTITDLTSRGLSERESHPLHGSPNTGSNWLVEGEIGHCWRHLVTLNALQFLTVEAGLYQCEEAGTSHHNSNNGPTKVYNNDKAIWTAWKHAKEQSYIPEDDPIPVRAMWHIARKHDIGDPKERPSEGTSEILPAKIYNEVLRTVEDDY
jgi:putative DNA primase/helicase